jgi:hypothetical protein
MSSGAPRRCSSLTKAGEPCKRPAQGHGEYCLGHASEGFREAQNGLSWRQGQGEQSGPRRP